jgi:hypothetical protein
LKAGLSAGIVFSANFGLKAKHGLKVKNGYDDASIHFYNRPDFVCPLFERKSFCHTYQGG